MIQYAGWADSAIAPENGLNYYEKVAKVMRDVHDFYRVFMRLEWHIVMGAPVQILSETAPVMGQLSMPNTIC